MDLLSKVLLVRITEEMLEKMKKAADKRGLKVSQLARMILKDWVDANDED